MASTIEKMKSQKFPIVSEKGWHDEIQHTSKGKTVDSFQTETIDQIVLQPLYTEEHLQKAIHYNGQPLTDVTCQMKVAQMVYADSAEEWLRQMTESFQKGNDVVVYDSSLHTWTWTVDTTSEFVSFLKEHEAILYLENEQDPIFQALTESALQDQKNITIFLDQTLTQIDTKSSHFAGGTIVHELSDALIRLEQLHHEGKLTDCVTVRFFIDTLFFQEIAKLRAFRLLVKAFQKATNTSFEIKIITETSVRSYSKLDEQVNMLRAGNEAFSAILGGADYVTIHPYNVLSKVTPHAARVARNTGLVLREETFTSQLIDPSAGSYFIETLTSELVEDAWKLFSSLMNESTYENRLENLHSKAHEVWTKRLHAISTRKQVLVGTNQYVNPAETIENTPPIQQNRLAEVFEKLQVNETLKNVNSSILVIGDYKKLKPKVDFVTGFLQAIGVQPTVSPNFSSIDEAIDATDAKTELVVIVANDDFIEETVQTMLQKKSDNQLITVAGAYKDTMNVWIENGLSLPIFTGQDLVKVANVYMEFYSKDVKSNDK